MHSIAHGPELNINVAGVPGDLCGRAIPDALVAMIDVSSDEDSAKDNAKPDLDHAENDADPFADRGDASAPPRRYKRPLSCRLLSRTQHNSAGKCESSTSNIQGCSV